MEKILLMLAHPRFEKSRANRALLSAARELPSVTLHDLYELYPDFNIDTGREHELLVQHSIIVWQFPLYMYSPPAMLKQWMDLVLEYGWAHGKGGKNLENKLIFSSVTTGGSSYSYRPGGFNRFPLQEFLRPLEQAACLCKMIWLPAFAVQGTYLQSPEQLRHHGRLYHRVLQRLSAGDYDLAHIRQHAFLNTWIEPAEGQADHD